jgi:hypothetical protein
VEVNRRGEAHGRQGLPHKVRHPLSLGLEPPERLLIGEQRIGELVEQEGAVSTASHHDGDRMPILDLRVGALSKEVEALEADLEQSVAGKCDLRWVIEGGEAGIGEPFCRHGPEKSAVNVGGFFDICEVFVEV